MAKDNDILYGMEQIRPVVGGASEVTVIAWKRDYPDFPIRKLRGQWVSHRSELADWWRRFVSGEKTQAQPVKEAEVQPLKKPVKQKLRQKRQQ